MRTPSQSQQDPRPKCPTCLLATAPPFRWNQDHCLQMQATKKASNRKPLIQQSNGERCTWSHQSKPQRFWEKLHAENQRKRSKTHTATAKTAKTLQWENAAGGGRRRDKGRARSPMVIFTLRFTYLSALLPSFPQSIRMMDASDGHESLVGRGKGHERPWYGKEMEDSFFGFSFRIQHFRVSRSAPR